jgi:hypothetical protein
MLFSSNGLIVTSENFSICERNFSDSSIMFISVITSECKLIKNEYLLEYFFSSVFFKPRNSDISSKSCFNSISSITFSNSSFVSHGLPLTVILSIKYKLSFNSFGRKFFLRLKAIQLRELPCSK